MDINLRNLEIQKVFDKYNDDYIYLSLNNML